MQQYYSENNIDRLLLSLGHDVNSHNNDQKITIIIILLCTDYWFEYMNYNYTYNSDTNL